jgi:hypothetical protein
LAFLLSQPPQTFQMAALQDFLNRDADDEGWGSKILNCIWPDFGTQLNTTDWKQYSIYFKTQCGIALKDQGKHVLARTLEDIALVRSLLARQITREELNSRMKTDFPTQKPCEPKIIDNTIDLVARLCLMINVRSCEFSDTRQTPLHWNKGSLQSFLAEHFCQPHVLPYRDISLNHQFTAENLVKIAGFRIKWTDNLADHLKIIDEIGLVVLVFKHVFFLEQHNP